MNERRVFVTALALALGAAISLGLARFSYALLLPPMRAELGWSYFTAGAMNTVNAMGYLVGALLLPRALARLDARLGARLGARSVLASPGNGGSAQGCPWRARVEHRLRARIPRLSDGLERPGE